MRYYIEATARALAALIVFTGAILMLAMVTSCGQFKSVSNVGKALLVDCAEPATLAVVNQIGPLVENMLIDNVDGEGHINFDPVLEVGSRWTAEVGGCILADVVARAMTPPSEDPKAPKASTASPLQLHREDLRTGFEQFKSSRFGGVTFVLASGQKL